MELLSQEQKDSAVEKIRKSNIEKRAREKTPTVPITESLIECSETIGRKIQKDIFRSHREILEKIWVIGRGLIFAKHFSKITGIEKTEMYRELRILEKAGLINIVKFYHQNILQLSQFSVNQFQRKTRMVTLSNANVIKHGFLGEILEKKLEQAVSKDVNIAHEVFFSKVAEQTNFCRTEKNENDDVWEKLDKLRKRDTYCQLSGSNLFVYVIDVYNADARRMIERIVQIYHFLNENDITEKFSVKFYICVIDERRKKYLDAKHARRRFETCLKNNQLLGSFPIRITSYNLTQRVFAMTRIVP